MQAKLLISFEGLSNADFLAQAQAINAALGNNADFPDPWPASLPTRSQLSDSVTAFQAAYQAALGGDKAKATTRDRTRSTLTTQLKKIAPYLEIVADGDIAMLETTGYDLRRNLSRSTGNGPLAAPADYKLARGTLSSVLIAKTRKLPGAASYEVQTAAADPTVDANWIDAGTYASCSHIELTSLTPGKVYGVRLRGIGTQGPGAWTQAASLMVV